MANLLLHPLAHYSSKRTSYALLNCISRIFSRGSHREKESFSKRLQAFISCPYLLFNLQQSYYYHEPADTLLEIHYSVSLTSIQSSNLEKSTSYAQDRTPDKLAWCLCDIRSFVLRTLHREIVCCPGRQQRIMITGTTYRGCHRLCPRCCTSRTCIVNILFRLLKNQRLTILPRFSVSKF